MEKWKGIGFGVLRPLPTTPGWKLFLAKHSQAYYCFQKSKPWLEKWENTLEKPETDLYGKEELRKLTLLSRLQLTPAAAYMPLWMSRIYQDREEGNRYNTLPSISLSSSTSLWTTLLCHGTTGVWLCPRCHGSDAHRMDGHRLPHHPSHLPGARSWKKRGGMG